jgi:hypothetical protein
MRIVWKDTAVVRKDFKYRGYWVEGYGDGWTVSIPGDDNVYRTNRCGKNAIDMALGLEGIRGGKGPERLKHGVDIIGEEKITG